MTQLMLPWLERHSVPATFSMPGRKEGAEGQRRRKKVKKGTVYWGDLDPNPRKASDHSLRSPILATSVSWSPETTQGQEETSLFMASPCTVSCSVAWWHTLSVTPCVFTWKDTDLRGLTLGRLKVRLRSHSSFAWLGCGHIGRVLSPLGGRRPSCL